MRQLIVVALVLGACGDDGGAAMKSACEITCDCDYNTVDQIEVCVEQCLMGPTFSDDCNACIEAHDRQCTTIDDCDETCST